MVRICRGRWVCGAVGRGSCMRLCSHSEQLYPEPGGHRRARPGLRDRAASVAAAMLAAQPCPNFLAAGAPGGAARAAAGCGADSPSAAASWGSAAVTERGPPRCLPGGTWPRLLQPPHRPPRCPTALRPPGSSLGDVRFSFHGRSFSWAGCVGAALVRVTAQPGRWDGCLPGLGQMLGTVWGQQQRDAGDCVELCAPAGSPGSAAGRRQLSPSSPNG